MATAPSILSHLSSKSSPIARQDVVSKKVPEVTQQLFRLMPIPIALLSADGTLCHANPAFCELAGFGVTEMLGTPLRALFRTWDQAEKAPLLVDGQHLVSICHPVQCWKLRIVQMEEISPFIPATRAIMLEKIDLQTQADTATLTQLQQRNTQLEQKVALLSAKLACREALQQPPTE